MPNPKNQKKKKPLVYPVVFMVVLTMIFTGGLASLNAFTIDRIHAQESVKNQASLLYAFGLDVPEDMANIQALYETTISEKTLNGTSYYVAARGQDVLGYAFPFSGSGLWGTIWGYVAVTPDFNEVLGIDFIKHAETPGLGGRISELWFREQFRGIVISDQSIVYRPSDGGNADAITGATLTSQAVRNMLNDALNHIENNIKGAL